MLVTRLGIASLSLSVLPLIYRRQWLPLRRKRGKAWLTEIRLGLLTSLAPRAATTPLALTTKGKTQEGENPYLKDWQVQINLRKYWQVYYGKISCIRTVEVIENTRKGQVADESRISFDTNWFDAWNGGRK